MENRAPLFTLAMLASLSILFSGCITHKEGYVNGTIIINGSALTQNMDHYIIEAGEGNNPTSWTMLGVINVNGGSANREETFLGELNTSMLPDGKYTIRLTVTDENGVSSEDRVYVNIDNTPDAQTRPCPTWSCSDLASGSNNVSIGLSQEEYGSNMDCSIQCTCPGNMKMGLQSEGDLESYYDYLRINSTNLTGYWRGTQGPYNSTVRIWFTSDRSIDGSSDYGGFNVTEILCTPYCFSSARSYGGEYISRVALGSGVRTSNKSYYSSYDSSPLTQLLRGQTYTIYVDVTTLSSYDEYVKVWIDYNQDYDLNGSGEEIDMGIVEVNDTYRFSKTFTVPLNAVLGRTLMRVTEAWSVAPGPCGQIVYGEVEDYSVDIVSTITSTTTTIPGQCSMAGDDPPCGQVTIGEVIAHINKWSAGTAGLSEIINLINAWAQSG
jgi:hypothetical protein